MKSIAVIVTLLALVGIWFVVLGDTQLGSSNGETYLERRQGFTTELLHPGPSPQTYEEETPPSGVEEIIYSSGGMPLKAWVYKPEESSQEKRPALVYFHGGFAFGKSDLFDCDVFIRAGFVVMVPMLRGENGNPGFFEMYMGEVDDGLAAVEWLAAQDYVDAENIFGFGHSAGGVISSLLSLFPESGLRHSGSIGGLYGPSFFEYDNKAPFDTSDPDECQLRSLIGNVKDMKKKHYAYVGSEDDGMSLGAAISEDKSYPGNLHISVLSGNHFNTVQKGFALYLEQVKGDLSGGISE